MDGDFDDFPDDGDRESIDEVAERFFRAWDEAEPPTPPPERTKTAPGRVVGVAAALAVLVAVPLLTLQQPAVSSQPTPSAGVLRLDPPVDEGPTVDLNWHGADGLRYAVVVAGASMPTKVIFVTGDQTTMRVPIDPVRAYCFLVQGTDGEQVYQTPPRAIRDAVCRW